MEIDGIKIKTVGFEPSHAELKEYVEFVKHKVGNVDSITATLVDDGWIDINYTKHNPKFERIRRITGYLSGTLDTWNNAKKSEERDRVKHTGGNQNEGLE